MKNIINKNSGFTITEILVAAGIMLVLGLGIATLTVNSDRGIRATEVKSELDSVFSTLKMALANQDICTANLANITGPLQINMDNAVTVTAGQSLAVNRVQVGADTLITAGDPVPTVNQFRSVDIRLQNIRYIAPDTFLSDLVFNFDRTAGSTLPLSAKTRSLSLELTTNGAAPLMRNVIRCRAAAGTGLNNLEITELQRETCVSMGGIFEANTGTCSANTALLSCPSGQYFAGFRSDWSADCQLLPPPQIVYVPTPPVTTPPVTTPPVTTPPVTTPPVTTPPVTTPPVTTPPVTTPPVTPTCSTSLLPTCGTVQDPVYADYNPYSHWSCETNFWNSSDVCTYNQVESPIPGCNIRVRQEKHNCEQLYYSPVAGGYTTMKAWCRVVCYIE